MNNVIRYIIIVLMFIAISLNSICMLHLTKRHVEYVNELKWMEARMQFLVVNVKFRDFGIVQRAVIRKLEKLKKENPDDARINAISDIIEYAYPEYTGESGDSASSTCSEDSAKSRG